MTCSKLRGQELTFPATRWEKGPWTHCCPRDKRYCTKVPLRLKAGCLFQDLPLGATGGTNLAAPTGHRQEGQLHSWGPRLCVHRQVHPTFLNTCSQYTGEEEEQESRLSSAFLREEKWETHSWQRSAEIPKCQGENVFRGPLSGECGMFGMFLD